MTQLFIDLRAVKAYHNTICSLSNPVEICYEIKTAAILKIITLDLYSASFPSLNNSFQRKELEHFLNAYELNLEINAHKQLILFTGSMLNPNSRTKFDAVFTQLAKIRKSFSPTNISLYKITLMKQKQLLSHLAAYREKVTEQNELGAIDSWMNQLNNSNKAIQELLEGLLTLIPKAQAYAQAAPIPAVGTQEELDELSIRFTEKQQQLAQAKQSADLLFNITLAAVGLLLLVGTVTSLVVGHFIHSLTLIILPYVFNALLCSLPFLATLNEQLNNFIDSTLNFLFDGFDKTCQEHFSVSTLEQELLPLAEKVMALKNTVELKQAHDAHNKEQPQLVDYFGNLEQWLKQEPNEVLTNTPRPQKVSETGLFKTLKRTTSLPDLQKQEMQFSF